MSFSERRRPKRRVLIADDSALMRSLLIEQIGANSDFEVVGEAATGYEAIRLVHQLKPDVLTLDLAMPDLGGLEALRYIMSQAPLPVVIVSAQTRALADSAIRALMEYGAVDIVPKPLGSSIADMQAFRQRLTQSPATLADPCPATAAHATAGAYRSFSRPVCGGDRCLDRWSARALAHRAAPADRSASRHPHRATHARAVYDLPRAPAGHPQRGFRL
jgi:chemotaxis response regulator CheB